jgi:endoglucanase
MNSRQLYSFGIIGIFIWTGLLVSIKTYQPPSDTTLLLVNQLGYLPQDDGKRLLLQIDTRPVGHETTAEFHIYTANDTQNPKTSQLTGNLVYKGELWNHHYYEANISDLRTTGKYIAETSIGTKKYTSYPFEIAADLYDRTFELAYQFFYYQRSGCEVLEIIPGYVGHEACHLDDANPESEPHNPAAWRNLTGAWFDAGDYNKYNGFTLEAVYSLIQVFDQNTAFFQTPERRTLYPNSSHATHFDQIPDVVEEAIWGADFLVKCVNENGSMIGRVGSNDFHGWYGYTGQPQYESDNEPTTPSDNRKYLEIAGYPVNGATALLKLARILHNNSWYPEKGEQYTTAVEKLQNYYIRPDQYNDQALLFYLEMYQFSNHTNQTYLDYANVIAEKILNSSVIQTPGFGHCGVDFPMYALGEWARINGSQSVKEKIIQAFTERWDSFWNPLSTDSNTDNIFRLLKGNHSNYGEFFFWSNRFPGVGDWNVGQNSYYLQAAAAAFKAYSFTNDSKYLQFGLRQLDWILGLNPFALCMMEGIGTYNPPTYHHRLDAVPGNIRGAVPGTVCNGIVRTPAKDKSITPDTPWFDFNHYYLEKGGGDYQSNEPWIPHNLYYLLAISELNLIINN